MKKLQQLLLITILSFVMVGCASVSKMPLQTDTATIDTTQKSILIARLKIKNDNHQSQQPDLCCVFMTKGDGDNSQMLSFTGPTLMSDNGEAGKDYFISMDVAPGKTKLNFARFIRQVPLLIMALAEVPLDYDIDVPVDKIVYLGNVDAVIIPRMSDSQLRAGPVIPLIDQAIAGFSNGTFKVSITDQFESDTKEMIVKFPALSGKEIVKNVLPNKDQ